jgi:hypothetical protein
LHANVGQATRGISNHHRECTPLGYRLATESSRRERVGYNRRVIMEIPVSLRRWFVAHALVDVAFGIPLLVTPTRFLHALGWTVVDPSSARLVGAALLAIGGQSYLGRHEGTDIYRAMLNLKIIWSAAAIVGLVVSIGDGAPAVCWAILSLFVAFFGVWIHHRIRIKQWSSAPDEPPTDSVEEPEPEDSPPDAADR